MGERRHDRASRACVIPAHATRLIGRRFVLENLFATASSSSSVVLWGPPGLGKSRLAHAFAAQWFEDSANGDVWVVDLCEARDEAEALGFIANAVGLPPTGSAETLRAHVARLLRRDRPLLLVLDHCERHAEVVASWAATWANTPGNLVLATSRVRIDHMHPFDVPALTEDEALQLLELRARRVRETFRIEDVDRKALTEIVSEVDALPAALELVGARLLLLEPEQLLPRLRSGEATLHSALEQSWELLDAEQQTALTWLAASRGGFGLDLAERMLGAGALPMLEALVEHAWLHVEDGPDGVTMRVLHEAQRFLRNVGVPPDAAAAHAAGILELAEVWDAGIESDDEVACTRQLIANLPNLWAAWSATTDDRMVARIGLVLHMALQRWGDHAEQSKITAAALRAAENTDDGVLIARAQLARARVLRWEGDHVAAIAMLQASVQGADPATKCSALRNLAASTWATGDLAATRVRADEALAAALDVGTETDEINARNGLGFLLSATGELDEARAQLERALELALRGDQATGLIALVSSSLAGLDARAGRWLESERHSSRTIAIYEDLGYRRQRLLELLYRAEARVAVGRVAAAMQDVESARSEASRWAYDGLARRALLIRGVVLLAAGDPAAALDALDEGSARLAGSDEQMLAEEFARASAAAHLLRGAPEAAAELTGHDELSQWLRALAGGREAPVPTCPEPLHAAVVRAVSGRSRQLRVHPDGRGFELDGGDEVSLTRRKALRGILHALAERHRHEPLSLDELLEAGWPGEIMTPESGSQRVYVTIKRLRDLGLDQVLLTVGDGYMLDPAIDVVRT